MKSLVIALLVAVAAATSAQAQVGSPIHTGFRAQVIATAENLRVKEVSGIYEGTTHASMHLLQFRNGKKQFMLKLINRRFRQPMTVVLNVLSEKSNRCGVTLYQAQEKRLGFDLPSVSMTLVDNLESVCGTSLRGWNAEIVYSGGLTGATEGTLSLQGIPAFILP